MNRAALAAVWRERPWFAVLLAVNAMNVGVQAGLVIGRVVRADWSGLAWNTAALVIAAFALYSCRYMEEWRLRVFVNLLAQRRALDIEIAMKEKILAAMEAGRMEVRAVEVDDANADDEDDDDEGTRH